MATDFISALPAVVAVLVVVLACRWVFGRRGVKHVVARPDYGLLSPVARRDTAEEAEQVRRHLADEGIRATVAAAGKGYDARGVPWPASAHIVLVFPQDMERAQALLTARH